MKQMSRQEYQSSAGEYQAEEQAGVAGLTGDYQRSEEHTSELQSQQEISYAVFCLTVAS